MLFIGSTGNNGTDRSQWLNYPSAYAGVVAVGAVNCRNEVQPWSQKNARVDIVAPGAGSLGAFGGGALQLRCCVWLHMFGLGTAKCPHRT